MGKQTYVSTKELAKLLGVSVATVNYYTNLGLFKIHDRRGNHRLYNEREVQAIFTKVKQMRREGYSLRLILRMIDKGYTI